jgi:LCP family protein required for cell wall assembly
VVVFPAGETPTPFLPAPVTGTPPPTSTPFPTAVPPITPTPTAWLGDFAPPDIPVYGIPQPFPNLSPEHHINFLLLGSDTRGGSSFRTDTIIIVMIDPDIPSVTLISLPRDLWVYIPGWTMNRINTAYLHGELEDYPGGGAGLLKDTIQYNLGLRIDHVALVDFAGFRKIVDTLGGIDVPLACPFTEWTVKDPNVSLELESNWKLITIGPGVVHMDGDMALWYARARNRSSDFDRGRRQQEVMRALYAAARSQNLLLQAPQLFEDFGDALTTDVSAQKIVWLVPVALEIDQAQIRSYFVGNELTWGWTTPGGASVLLPNAAAIYAMLAEAVSPPASGTTTALVEILNASGNADWDTLAAERLAYGGYEASVPGAAQDEVNATFLYDLTPDGRTGLGRTLLEILGLPADRLRYDPQASRETDFRLVLGADYDPCFNPAQDG